MNGIRILADSNLFIYALQGVLLISSILSDLVIHYSGITKFEMMALKSLSKKDRKLIDDFLAPFTFLNINESIVDQSIIYRHKYNLKLPDSIIAATARINDLILLTADRDFESIDDLEKIII